MRYKKIYQTSKEFSDLSMYSDGEYLTGLWFEGAKDRGMQEADCEEKDLPVFAKTSNWLDLYFSGRVPDFTPKYKMSGLTPFRKEVIDIMNTIDYGKILSYNQIGKIIAGRRGIERMSAQAVGGAVGWNPICIIVPCHRVMGAKGKLTGYGGGIDNKIALLKHEGIFL